MNWLAVFFIGFCVGHVVGVFRERVTWWERHARANRRVEELGTEAKEEIVRWPEELEEEG